MKIWMMVIAVVGGLLLGLSIFFFIKDSATLSKQKKKGTFLIPNITLLTLSLSCLAFAGFLYLDMQNQINLFLK